MVALTYLLKMGGHKKYTINENIKGNMGRASETQYYNNCGIPTELSECSSRYRITQESGFIGMETRSISISENLPETSLPPSGPICIKGISSTGEICVMETRSTQSMDGCNDKNVDRKFHVCIPPFFNDCTSPKKGYQRESDKNDNYHTSMAQPTVVSPNPRNVDRETYFDKAKEKPVIKPNEKGASTDRKPNSYISGLVGFRDQLSTGGLSKRAIDLIGKSRR